MNIITLPIFDADGAVQNIQFEDVSVAQDGSALRPISAARITGSNATVGGLSFALDSDGQTLVGLEANRPTVADAVAALGLNVMWRSKDTQTTYETDGTNWLVV